LIDPPVAFEVTMSHLLGSMQQLGPSDITLVDTECYHLLTPKFPTIPSPQCKVYHIPIDLESPTNRTAPYPSGEDKYPDRLKWDISKRELASKAEKPETFDEFITKVSPCLPISANL
jgi:hypothetical protein